MENKIYSLLAEKKISQASAAAALGISAQRFNDILKKRRPMRIEYILPLCEVLMCEPNELFGRKKENHQITVTDDDGQVIAAILGDSVVEYEGFHVILS